MDPDAAVESDARPDVAQEWPEPESEQDAGIAQPDQGETQDPDALVEQSDEGIIEADAAIDSPDAIPEEADAALEPDADLPEDDPDAMVEEPEPPQEVILYVNRADEDDVQFLESGEEPVFVELTTFEFCTEGGAVDITSISVNFLGNFFEHTMRVTAGEMLREEEQSPWDRAVFLSPENPQHIEDGDCLQMLVEDLDQIENWSYWIRPDVDSVSTAQEVTVVFEQQLPDVTPGRHSVWQLERSANLRATLGGEPIVHRRNVQDVRAGYFELCTMDNAQVDLTGIQFQIDGATPDTVFPLEFNVRFESYTQQHFDLLPSIDGEVAPGPVQYSPGDLVTLDLVRRNGDPETVRFGACFTIEIRLLFVPRGAESLTISARNVLTQDNIRILVAGQWEAMPTEAPFTPLPWTQLIFQDPPPQNGGGDVQGIIQMQWPFTPWQTPRYLDRYKRNPCTGWSFSAGEPVQEDDPVEECPLIRSRLNVNNIDERFPVELTRVTYTVTASDLPGPVELDFVIWTRDRRRVIERNIQVNNGNNVIDLVFEHPVNIERMDWGLIASNVLPIAGSHEAHIPELQFSMTAEAEQDGERIDIVHGSPDNPQQLPVQDVDFILHDPALWITGGSNNGPVRTVDIADDIGEPTVLLDVAMENLYQYVAGCEFTFFHNSGKDISPFDRIEVHQDQINLVMTEWNRELVRLSVEDRENCVQFWTEREFNLQVLAWGPRATTDPGSPLRLSWVSSTINVGGVEDDRQGFVPESAPIFYDHDDEGNPLQLGLDGSVSGRTIEIIDTRDEP